MKKIFTLIAVAVMALSAQAQGSYAINVDDQITAGQVVETVDNVTLTYSSGGGTFIAGKSTANWVIPTFLAYTNGSSNGKFSAGKEPTGCYYKFETKKPGKITAAIQLSPNKGMFVVDQDFNAITYTYDLPVKKDGAAQTLVDNGKGELIIPSDGGVKSNGTVTFPVLANGTYYVLATGTKLGFFGFEYTVDNTTGINDINIDNANAPVEYFNLQGIRVENPANGLYIRRQGNKVEKVYVK